MLLKENALLISYSSKIKEIILINTIIKRDCPYYVMIQLSVYTCLATSKC